ncbi:HI_0552 family protein [Streptococcus infantis]|uniref:HI_0552 family protein n=1 Tax=Streptococcus infantis TaxID=68892 RepID=UPI0039C4424C
MLNTMREYLAFSGLQYQKPEKAGQEAEKMLYLRSKGQEARKVFTHLAKAFQERHPEWDIQGTSQWMNQAQRLRPHFWAYLQREGEVTEPMLALRLYGSPSDFGVSLEVSFIERKKDDKTLDKQAKVLEVPVVDGIYYLVYSNGESHKMEATEENRQILREKLSHQEVRKVLVKSDVPVTDRQSLDKFLDELDKSFEKLLPYYQATRN